MITYKMAVDHISCGKEFNCVNLGLRTLTVYDDGIEYAGIGVDCHYVTLDEAIEIIKDKFDNHGGLWVSLD